MFDWFWSKSTIDDSKQRVLGPAENVLMKASQLYQGLGRVGEILCLEGPYISPEQLNKAITRLQHRHPALRSRLQRHPNDPNHFILEQDETALIKVEEIPRKRTNHFDFWINEWRHREKDPLGVGDILIKFWLLQDPDDRDDANAPREIVLMAEHCICDGLSLSSVAHELLIILSSDDENVFNEQLPWSITMEDAIRTSLSLFNRYISVVRFMSTLIYDHMTSRLATARIPLGKIDFPIDEMDKHCYTGIIHGILNKEMTSKLISKCRQEGATVTSAVLSAIFHATASLVPNDQREQTLMKFSLGADTRRRCHPPVPNHALGYQASSVAPFSILTSQVPTAIDGLWRLSKTINDHMKASVDAGHVLACGLILSRVFEMTLGLIDMSKVPTYGVSSWGVLPFVEQYGPWKLTNMMPFVNLIRGPLPFTTIQTVNGILTVMFGGSDPFIESTTLTILRDTSMDIVQRMIDS